MLEAHTFARIRFFYLCFIISLDGTSGITYNIPQSVTQKVINKAIAEKDWNRLHLLFMGGGGDRRFEKGSGGLGTGCDASIVPLEEVIRCDFPDLMNFISILLDHKASANPRKGGKDPLDVAIEVGKFEVVNILMDRNNKTGAGVNPSTTSQPHKVSRKLLSKLPCKTRKVKRKNKNIKSKRYLELQV